MVESEESPGLHAAASMSVVRVTHERFVRPSTLHGHSNINFTNEMLNVLTKKKPRRLLVIVCSGVILFEDEHVQQNPSPTGKGDAKPTSGKPEEFRI